MVKCTKVKELVVTTQDKPGMLAELSSVVASQGVNIIAICAYSMQGKAVFMLVSSDNQKVKAQATSKGWKVEDREAIMVELVDKVGAAKEVGDKLKAKNVNLRYCYGTTCTCAPDCACRLVFSSDNNDAILAALK